MLSSILFKKFKWTKLKMFNRLHLGTSIKKDAEVINQDKLVVNFIKGSGPGGQNVNKRNNCVQLIYDDINIKCHSTRSQSQNLAIARQLLRERIKARSEESKIIDK
eukprot:NODE_76_length_23837_cov_1.242396.p21 type:complete len:106 gc:universal NODE_76_length_23837_cov_1.242396:16687-16370(-)